MENILISGNLNQKIKWYIRAHGHSCIGGLNLLWTYFNYSGSPELAELVQESIDNFETFGKKEDDVSEQLKVLENNISEIEYQIESIGLEKEKKDEMQHILIGVDNNIKRIKAIIKDNDYKEEVRLSNVLDSAITELLIRYPNTFFGDVVGSQNVGSNIKIDFEMKGDEKEIIVCGYEMQLLLYNLISNAIDAIIYGGGEGNVWISFGFLEDGIEINVADDGKAISKENLAKIKSKKPFTTKGGKHGNGMKIIYDIVEKYNAVLQVESNSEKTMFNINLPSI